MDSERVDKTDEQTHILLYLRTLRVMLLWNTLPQIMTNKTKLDNGQQHEKYS